MWVQQLNNTERDQNQVSFQGKEEEAEFLTGNDGFPLFFSCRNTSSWPDPGRFLFLMHALIIIMYVLVFMMMTLLAYFQISSFPRSLRPYLLLFCVLSFLTLLYWLTHWINGLKVWMWLCIYCVFNASITPCNYSLFVIVPHHYFVFISLTYIDFWFSIYQPIILSCSIITDGDSCRPQLISS